MLLRKGQFFVLLVSLALTACTKPPAPEPATVTFFDIGPWANKEYADWGEQALQRFTRETGIAVRRLPAPESADDQLAFVRRLLESGAATPDVYIIDAIWPAMLADHLLDLRPWLAGETADHFPALVANGTVGGRLVAMPYYADAGVLYFRTDLLRDYGYRTPPATWDELEKMAAAIQAGERAKGRADFWGFVWQGASYEGLTCNALEWQVAAGGGRIIEADGTITVNNPRTVESWQRAARWVGSISPPGVVAYLESDATNAFRSGHAAFMRGWPTAYSAGAAEGSAIAGRFDLTSLPAGRSGRAATVGENSLGVSRYSPRAGDAMALVRYLTRKDVQLWRSRMTSLPPTVPALYEHPDLLKTHPMLATLKKVLLQEAIARPSTVAGRKYGDVSTAYSRAVHSVLTGRAAAAQAAAGLERELVRITGAGERRP